MTETARTTMTATPPTTATLLIVLDLFGWDSTWPDPDGFLELEPSLEEGGLWEDGGDGSCGGDCELEGGGLLKGSVLLLVR